MLHLINKIRSLIVNFRLTLLAGMAITVASLMPGNRLPSMPWTEIPLLDKWVHVMIYLVFAFLWRVEWERSGGSSSVFWQRTYWVLGTSAVMGICLEVLQAVLQSGRYFEVLDIIANIIGALIALIGYHWLNKN